MASLQENFSHYRLFDRLAVGGMGGDEDAGAALAAGPRPDAGLGRLRVQSRPSQAEISLCGKPTSKLTPGTLQVTSIRPGTVQLDGRTAGNTPRLELKLRPGTYQVRVRFASGGASRQVEVQKGRTTRVHIDPEL